MRMECIVESSQVQLSSTCMLRGLPAALHAYALFSLGYRPLRTTLCMRDTEPRPRRLLSFRVAAGLLIKCSVKEAG